MAATRNLCTTVTFDANSCAVTVDDAANTPLTSTVATSAVGIGSDLVQEGKTVRKYATAADVPIELYDLILYFLERELAIDSHRGEQDHRNGVTVGKRELGQLALVCLSWSHMCQKKLFAILTLRSRQDFLELLSLASHSCSRIALYIQHLQLRPDNNSTPWIHTVCTKVRSQSIYPRRPGSPFPAYEGHIMDLRGAEAQDVVKRGPHAALPKRLLPAAYSRGMTILAIGGMKLDGLEQVVRLCRELRTSLRELQLWGLKWSTGAPSIEGDKLASLVNRRLGERRALLTAVAIVECTEAWVSISLLSILDNAHSLASEDVCAISTFARIFTAGVESTGHPTPMAYASRTEWGYLLMIHATADQHLTPLVWFVTAHDTQTGRWRVDTIALVFAPFMASAMHPLSATLKFNWEGFGQQAASLSTLRCVVVALSSREDLAYFAKEIEPKMPMLSDSHQLKYALGYADPSKNPVEGWTACVPSNPDKGGVSGNNAKRVTWSDLHKLYA